MTRTAFEPRSRYMVETKRSDGNWHRGEWLVYSQAEAFRLAESFEIDDIPTRVVAIMNNGSRITIRGPK